MTDLKQIKIYATETFRLKLQAMLKDKKRSMSSFIADAITEKAKRDYDVDLGVTSAPHGVRSDALPIGWKSRLYRDRYQLVAKFTETGFELTHYHLFTESLDNRIFDTLNAETPEPVEITVIDIPPNQTNNRDAISHELQLAYISWLNS